MIELLKLLAPWVNDTKGRKAGSLSTVVALLALAIYAAQTLLLPALTQAPPAPAPAVESTSPATPANPEPPADVAPLDVGAEGGDTSDAE